MAASLEAEREELGTGLDWLDDDDLLCLRAEDEDLGDEMGDPLEWEMPDDDEMLLPGCTPKRTRQRASPWRSREYVLWSRKERSVTCE